MGSSLEGRLGVIDRLLKKPAIASVLFHDISAELEEVGAKPCALMLTRAHSFRKEGQWDACREASLKAREYAWEQLHR